MNNETRRFILENTNADIHQLALQSARFPQVDMPFAIRQINGKQKIKGKIPLFYNNEAILYPAQLSLEQSSSESTAKYKASLCEGNTLTDLTGGFGIDCCFMAEKFGQVTYIERQAELCSLAEHNFGVLGLKNIEVVHADSGKKLSEMDKVDWIYLDPARRSSGGKKVILLSDCEPDVSALSVQLLEKANQVMIKLSPMIDIRAVQNELPNTAEVHILSVDNECKEVLVILGQTPPENIRIKTINLTRTNENQAFEYLMHEESDAEVSYTSEIKSFLYEPNASIMKSGGFKTIGTAFGLSKLHTNTHLYTSTELKLQFPGRAFEVSRLWGSSKKEWKELAISVPKANITTRNFPLSVDELRKKLKIKEGGEVYLFACTLTNEQKVIVECRKVH